mgnify:CR=1 FL=1
MFTTAAWLKCVVPVGTGLFQGYRSIHKGFDRSVFGGLDRSGLVGDRPHLHEENVVSHKEFVLVLCVL